MKLISQKTAYDIWISYDEIQKGEALLAEMQALVDKGEVPNLRDPFGRQRNLQLGVPSGERSHMLMDVKPDLAMSVIKAHIASKRSELEVCCQRAWSEMHPTPSAA